MMRHKPERKKPVPLTDREFVEKLVIEDIRRGMGFGQAMDDGSASEIEVSLRGIIGRKPTGLQVDLNPATALN